MTEFRYVILVRRLEYHQKRGNSEYEYLTCLEVTTINKVLASSSNLSRDEDEKTRHVQTRPMEKIIVCPIPRQQSYVVKNFQSKIDHTDQEL